MVLLFELFDVFLFETDGMGTVKLTFFEFVVGIIFGVFIDSVENRHDEVAEFFDETLVFFVGELETRLIEAELVGFAFSFH